MIFRAEFHDRAEMPEQMELLEEDLEEMDEDSRAYIEHKSMDIIARMDELDAAINERAQGWKTSRMSKVDVSIIRLALYEIRYEEEIPLKVSINEAVELAKKFGTDDSASFVNGILAKFA